MFVQHSEYNSVREQRFIRIIHYYYFNIKAADQRCHDGQMGGLHLMSAKRVGRGCEMVGERVDICGWLQLHYLRAGGDKKWERL